MGVAVAALALALTVGAPADVTGRWEGTISGTRPDGTTAEDTALLILEQKGTEVTGTIGGNDADRHQIAKGTVDGNKLSIVAKNRNNEREIRVEVTVDGEDMKGTLILGPERKAELVAKRVKR
jgi:hypothetical protein